MLHKNAVVFAVVSHIYCKTYGFDVFAAVLWGSRRKSGAVSAGFIENAVVLGGRSSARRVDLGLRRGRVFCQMHCGSARYSGILRGVLPQSSRFCVILASFACRSECSRCDIAV